MSEDAVEDLSLPCSAAPHRRDLAALIVLCTKVDPDLCFKPVAVQLIPHGKELRDIIKGGAAGGISRCFAPDPQLLQGTVAGKAAA